mmetsp:Transcript_795/g.1669  ORF Transcript_795/g.1669 Transcript_795/m.1669 type:complete len:250 (-) Transcript_795:152-901(-)
MRFRFGHDVSAVPLHQQHLVAVFVGHVGNYGAQLLHHRVALEVVFFVLGVNACESGLVQVAPRLRRRGLAFHALRLGGGGGDGGRQLCDLRRQRVALGDGVGEFFSVRIVVCGHLGVQSGGLVQLCGGGEQLVLIFLGGLTERDAPRARTLTHRRHVLLKRQIGEVLGVHRSQRLQLRLHLPHGFVFVRFVFDDVVQALVEGEQIRCLFGSPHGPFQAFRQDLQSVAVTSKRVQSRQAFRELRFRARRW